VSLWFGSDTKLPQTRLAVISYVIVGLTLLLLIGFWKIQIIDSTRYQEAADRNRIRTIPMIAPRGKMLDREGRIIVDNYPSFSVLLLRDDMAQVTRVLPQISEGLGLGKDDIQQQLDGAKWLAKYEPIIIKPEATQADIAFIESHRPDLPMLEMVMVHRRRYPPNGFLAGAIGYVGEVSEADIERSEDTYRPGDMVGKSGLEKQYNEIMQGTDGQRRIEVDSRGRETGRLDQVEPIPGKNIQLTIDADLQAAAEESLGARKGAIVALDPRSGEVLAYVSHPAPDPNAFAVRIQKEEWQRLNSDPDKPLLDRVIQAQLAPGSVFKVIMATAILESKAVPESTTIFCPGQTTLMGRVWHCWDPKGHGTVDLEKAVVHSCDVFFYNMGIRLGIDRMSYYATQMGLGKITGIDLPGEQPGLMPSAEWKERRFHQPWYPGENISVGVGQGAIETTPIQLARMMGGLATGGVFKQPHLLKNSDVAPEMRFAISPETVEKLTGYMEEVVNPGGTANAAFVPGAELAGKTGTAQTISDQGLAKAANRNEHKYTAWFVGFAPRKNPEIVIAILVQDTWEHSSEAAAPLAKSIVKTYFDKKNGNFKSPSVAMNGGEPVPWGVPGAPPTQQPKAPKPAGQPAGLPEPRQQAPAPAKRSPTTH
jgi:penicillin-binding protein 2